MAITQGFISIGRTGDIGYDEEYTDTYYHAMVNSLISRL